MDMRIGIEPGRFRPFFKRQSPTSAPGMYTYNCWAASVAMLVCWLEKGLTTEPWTIVEQTGIHDGLPGDKVTDVIKQVGIKKNGEPRFFKPELIPFSDGQQELSAYLNSDEPCLILYPWHAVVCIQATFKAGQLDYLKVFDPARDDGLMAFVPPQEAKVLLHWGRQVTQQGAQPDAFGAG